jgi:hypothetical protein
LFVPGKLLNPSLTNTLISTKIRKLRTKIFITLAPGGQNSNNYLNVVNFAAVLALVIISYL